VVSKTPSKPAALVELTAAAPFPKKFHGPLSIPGVKTPRVVSQTMGPISPQEVRPTRICRRGSALFLLVAIAPLVTHWVLPRHLRRPKRCLGRCWFATAALNPNLADLG
jgi:hypothetical protein